MKKSYNVWWSETAENDLVSILEYVAGENPLQARKIFGEIKKRAESLNVFPDRGRMVPELQIRESHYIVNSLLDHGV